MSDVEIPPLSDQPYLIDDPEDDRPRLQGCECADCGKRVFPPVAVCPECLGENIKPLPLSREGLLYSYTAFEQGARWVGGPYIAAYIDMPEGVRVFTHIDVDDPGRLTCDMPVILRVTEPVVNADGREVLKFKFAPRNGEKN